ncbi:MAG TPA: hypothetical protein VK200_00975 [Candidatus Limnocylindrales bacterium]|nr:hypothetical protein [Candidatus Limnocylindrales bacterium]
MSQRFGPITVALTGQLAIILLLSAILALVASFLILRLYRRAVIKSMRRRNRSDILEPKGFLPAEPEHQPHDAPLTLKTITRESLKTNTRAATLYHRAIRRRWSTAVIHTLAGCGFAATMAVAFLVAGKTDISPNRLLFFIWVNAWPVVLAIDLAVGLSRRGRFIAIATYFFVGEIVISGVAGKNLGLPVGQLLYLWLEANFPATLLLVVFLNRRLRAVGPLVLVFMVLSVTGAILVVTFTGNNRTLLKTLTGFSMSIGLGAAGTLVILHIIGFAVFAIAGWIILGTLRRLYAKKHVSEQSITIDAVWLLFGVVNSIRLVSHGPSWILSGLTAYLIYKFIAACSYRLSGLARLSQSSGRRLLLLRVFSIDGRSQALYETLGKSWRTVGSIQMIAGRDLAASAMEPHEFLDFVAGKLDRRFIDSGRTLDVRVNQMDLQPDKEGQFRVTEFFCHDDTWKMSLARVADDSDVVLMDLRGFSSENSGFVLEIHELFNVVALSRVIFIVDNTTDQAFLRQTMQDGWQKLKTRSPNRRLPAAQISLVDLSGMTRAGFHNLLYALCTAATAETF